jgi:hypothetical protein
MRRTGIALCVSGKVLRENGKHMHICGKHPGKACATGFLFVISMQDGQVRGRRTSKEISRVSEHASPSPAGTG